VPPESLGCLSRLGIFSKPLVNFLNLLRNVFLVFVKLPLSERVSDWRRPILDGAVHSDSSDGIALNELPSCRMPEGVDQARGVDEGDVSTLDLSLDTGSELVHGNVAIEKLRLEVLERGGRSAHDWAAFWSWSWRRSEADTACELVVQGKLTQLLPEFYMSRWWGGTVLRI